MYPVYRVNIGYDLCRRTTQCILVFVYCVKYDCGRFRFSEDVLYHKLCDGWQLLSAAYLPFNVILTICCQFQIVLKSYDREL